MATSWSRCWYHGKVHTCCIRAAYVLHTCWYHGKVPVNGAKLATSCSHCSSSRRRRLGGTKLQNQKVGGATASPSPALDGVSSLAQLLSWQQQTQDSSSTTTAATAEPITMPAMTPLDRPPPVGAVHVPLNASDVNCGEKDQNLVRGLRFRSESCLDVITALCIEHDAKRMT